MTNITTGAPRGNRVPTELDFVEDRLRCCLSLIEGTRDRSAEEKRALCWMLGEEFVGLLPRLWRASR